MVTHLSICYAPYSPQGRKSRVIPTLPSRFLPSLLSTSSSRSQVGATGQKRGRSQEVFGQGCEVFIDTSPTQETSAGALAEAAHPGDQPPSCNHGAPASPSRGWVTTLFTSLPKTRWGLRGVKSLKAIQLSATSIQIHRPHRPPSLPTPPSPRCQRH